MGAAVEKWTQSGSGGESLLDLYMHRELPPRANLLVSIMDISLQVTFRH